MRTTTHSTAASNSTWAAFNRHRAAEVPKGSARFLLDYYNAKGDLADTIRGFKGLCEGKYDHLPEAAFYMVGTIDQAVERSKKLAEAA